MSIYDDVKRLVPMRELIEHYGFEVNRQGFIRCPFHDEDTPSMKIYTDSCWCFGCNTGGDAVNFTARLFHIKNSQAALKINNDFHLGLSTSKPDIRVGNLYLKKQAEEKLRLEAYRKEYNDKAEQFRRLFYSMSKEGDVWKKAEMQSELDYLEYWFSENEWK